MILDRNESYWNSLWLSDKFSSVTQNLIGSIVMNANETLPKGAVYEITLHDRVTDYGNKVLRWIYKPEYQKLPTFDFDPSNVGVLARMASKGRPNGNTFPD